MIVFSNDSRSITSSGNRSEDSSVQGNYDYFAQSEWNIYIYICVIILWLYLTWLNSFSFHEKNIIVGNGGLERLISSHVEVSKIGRQIAEEVLDLQRRGEDSSSGSSPGPESALLNTEVVITMEIPVKILHFLWDVKQFIRYYTFNFNDLYRV